MVKSILFLLLSLVISSTKVVAAQKVTVLVEDAHFAPFKFTDENGDVTGIYPAIVREAVSRMPEYAVEFKEVPWARAKLMMKAGQAFAMLPPYFHAHDWLTDDGTQRPYIWPYSMSLFTQTDVVVCDALKMGESRTRWPDDYQDLSFVMQRGDGIAGAVFDKMVEEKKIEVYFTGSNLETIKLVLLGKYDCTVIPQAVFSWFIRELKHSGEYSKLNKIKELKESSPISTNEGYLGYTDINVEKSYPFKKDFTIKFDIEIYKMKRSGELQEIINRFTKD